jgi:hypothetical protein
VTLRSLNPIISSDLLLLDYQGSDFPNAKLRSYVVRTGDNSNSLVYLASEAALASQRTEQSKWRAQVSRQRFKERKELREGKRKIQEYERKIREEEETKSKKR